MKIKQIGLYVIIDKGFLGDRDLLAVAKKAIEGGADIIQYRDKVSSSSEILKNAVQLAGLAKKTKVPFIVNDRVDIAIISKADGVHIGADDIPVNDARKLLGKNKIIGYSTHSVEEAVSASKTDVDYLSVGPIFYSKTKMVTSPLGTDAIRRVAAKIKKPIAAIGGIDSNNIGDVMCAGASGAAVISFVCGARDPKKAAEVLRGKINQ